ncbi:MAG: hypothetical protein C0619_08535 [Desulfuromonas sp.]|nr:MAG: hypothetical protein C0619_08535 [Desulfuromonas sp.]
MEYSQGERVRFLGKPEWGSGFVQKGNFNGKVTVSFQGAGTKTLDLKYAKLMKVIERRKVPRITLL